MKLKVYNLAGKAVGEQELSAKVFEVKIKPEVVHEVFVAQTNNQRQPWADTKNRGEVSGGGKNRGRKKAPAGPAMVPSVPRFGKAAAWLLVLCPSEVIKPRLIKKSANWPLKCVYPTRLKATRSSWWRIFLCRSQNQIVCPDVKNSAG